MKTVQELYNEIMASQELKAQFIEAAKAGKQEEFLKAHGCEATLEEVKSFLEAKQQEDAPLSFDELENAAGGECNRNTGKETAISILSVGMACALEVIISVTGVVKETHHVDQEKEGEGRLCNEN